jgi:Na+-transporting methylmalonyl-CoA/oxaloacetate decarboxylase gamma subunit
MESREAALYCRSVHGLEARATSFRVTSVTQWAVARVSRPHFQAALRAVSGRDARATPGIVLVLLLVLFLRSGFVLLLLLFLVLLIVLLLRHSQDVPEHKPENEKKKEYEKELMRARRPRHFKAVRVTSVTGCFLMVPKEITSANLRRD